MLTGPKTYNPLAYAARQNIRDIVTEGREVRLFWVRAHADTAGNERADELARNASLKRKTVADYDRFPLSYAKNVRDQVQDVLHIHEECPIFARERAETEAGAGVIIKIPKLNIKKSKAGVFDDAQIQRLMKDECFLKVMIKVEAEAWSGFVLLKHFLGDYSEDQEEHFYQDSKVMDKRYQGLSQNLERLDSRKDHQRKSSESDNGEIISMPKPVFHSNGKKTVHQRIHHHVITPQHEEIIKYISETWIQSTYGESEPSSPNSSSGSESSSSSQLSNLYYQDEPNPALCDFKAFDLETWWGKRLFQNITNSL
ncbi:hypothetical protein EVAR_36464_1 [Eumeta japonica]|uniref:RNase H type-1 domain-containing protein n=1 Tax=Eumeta variegata TaxID=151549 RepID=A0A4C1WVI4_EUMVA|nr:hypothetical protein EVAR_36464_1 [Eumeta japonica]